MRCVCGHVKEEHATCKPAGCLHRDLRKLCKCEDFVEARPLIVWKRPTGGYCESACGRWKISPLYCGRVKPQFYELRCDGKVIAARRTTQRAAKAAAEVVAARQAISKGKLDA